MRAHKSRWAKCNSGTAGAGAMPCAAACPARPERAGASARARAARRLRRLARGLTPHRAAGAGAGAGAAEMHNMSPCAAAPWDTRAAGPADATCLAARALSQMLCDEPNAAHCRATVRRNARRRLVVAAAAAPCRPRRRKLEARSDSARPTHRRRAPSPPCTQALQHGAAAALWQRALRGTAPPPLQTPPPAPPSSPSSQLDGAGARDGLAHAVATALGDLLANRGDDAVGAAALLVARDPRIAAWYGATVQASRPLRVAAAGDYLLSRVNLSSASCLGVRPPAPRPRSPATAQS